MVKYLLLKSFHKSDNLIYQMLDCLTLEEGRDKYYNLYNNTTGTTYTNDNNHIDNIINHRIET
jgi:hypothetical protein